MNKKGNLLYWIFLLALIIGGIMWTIFQWKLCRSEGLNFWYCIQHIG